MITRLAIPFNDLEIFTQDSFADLAAQCKEKRVPFYVAATGTAVTEEKIETVANGFFFHAASFLCNFLEKKNSHPTNPLTNQRIHAFTVYELKHEPDQFISIFCYPKDKDMLEKQDIPTVLFPVFSKDLREAGALFFTKKGDLFSGINGGRKNIEKAIQCYRYGANMGSQESRKKLYCLLGEKGLYEEALYWALTYYNSVGMDRVAAIDAIGACIYLFGCVNNLPADCAHYLLEKGVIMGNCLCVVGMISWYENGCGGVSPNPDMARSWRQLLPKEWADSSIDDLKSWAEEGSESKDVDSPGAWFEATVKALSSSPTLLTAKLDYDLNPDTILPHMKEHILGDLFSSSLN